MNNDYTVGIEITAKDKASRQIKDVVKELDKIGDVTKKLDAFGKQALIAGAVLSTGLGLAAKTAVDFEKSMANVSTLVDTNLESMEAMSNNVLDIAKRTPVALSDLTGALYNVRSAGISAENAMGLLEKSAKLGVAGLGSTNEAVDLVTSAVNAWGLQGRDAEKIYDNIFKTVKAGKTTISELAQGFGAVAGTVATAGIKTDEYLSAVAALTTTGEPASKAHTQLKASIAGLTRESKETKAVFKELGAKNFKDLIEKSGGMVGAFDKVRKSLKGNDEMILKIFGSTEAYNAVMGLTGNQAEAFASTLDSMRNGKDLFDEGYQKQLKTSAAQFQLMQNNLQKLGVTFGTILLPPLNKAIGGIVKIIDAIDKLPQPVKSVVVAVTAFGAISLTVLGASTLALSGLIKTMQIFAPTMTARVVPAILAAVKASLMWVSTIFKNIIQSRIWTMSLKEGVVTLWASRGALLANTKALIVNAVQGLGAAIKSIWRYTAVLAYQKVALLVLTAANLGFAGSFRALGVAIISTPIIGWIVGLISLAILLVKNWDKVVASFKKVVNAAKGLPIFGGKGGTTPVAKSEGTLPKFDVGSKFISQTGLAIVHKGEAIAPANTVKSVFSSPKNTGGAVSLTYSPNITISGGASGEAQSNFAQMLKSHKDEILSIINNAVERKMRLAY